MTLSAAYKQIFGLPSGGGDGQGNRKSFRPPSHPKRICLRVIRHQDEHILQNIFYECCVQVHYGTRGSLSNDDGDGNANGKKTIELDRQNNNFARASRFFVHFLAVVARLQRESAVVIA